MKWGQKVKKKGTIVFLGGHLLPAKLLANCCVSRTQKRPCQSLFAELIFDGCGAGDQTTAVPGSVESWREKGAGQYHVYMKKKNTKIH